uniref:Uncharacterized protein LOC100178505 n=1 Tax=Phallusia mammillata TaxID=59560 RepID=A0A6F9DHQ3_9ASCI|nr:uncharacterized protein LOC100178505 [Phallusia mammillata]
MQRRQPQKKQPVSKNYVLVVDFNGEPDIFQLSYDTSWRDVAALLQVKYECDDLKFTYSDDDDDKVGLCTEEDFAIALKMAKKNDDVLHVQLKSQTQPQTVPASGSSSPTGVSYTETSKSSIGTGLAWASKAVKQAVHGFGQSLVSATNDNHSSINMDEMETMKESETSEQMVTSPERIYNNTPRSSLDPQNQQHSNIEEMDTRANDEMMASSARLTRTPVNVTDEIEVPTSLEDEVSVKMPYTGESSSCEEGTSAEKVDPLDMRQTIRQEVRFAINQEMSALREEIQSNLLPQLRNVTEPAAAQSSDDSMSKPVRSPKSIKREIRQLKKEMSEAKLQKRQRKKRHDKTSSDEVSAPQSSKEMRQARKFAASFICENLLDGSSVGTGQTFTKYWVLKNEGTRSWDHKIKLELLKETPSSDGSPVDASICSEAFSHPSNKQWGPERQQVSLPTVNSRETTVIAVRHVAPHHECSYTSSWRLHRKGQPFGPRIWCNVSVVNHDQMPVVDSQPCLTLLTTDDEKSYISHKESSEWIRPRHPSSQSEHHQSSLHDDDISNMFSFEMTDIGENFPQHSQPAMSTSYSEPCKSHLSSIPQKTDESQASKKDAEPTVMLTTEAENKDEVALVEEPTVDAEEPAPVIEEEPPTEDVVVEEEENETAPNEEQDEEFESLKDPSHYEQIEVQNPDVTEDRDEAEDRLRDEQFDSTSSSQTGGDESHSSECMSDFEVIPLPECFDTTRPLSSSEKDDKSNPTSLTEDKTEKQESQTTEMMVLNDAEQVEQIVEQSIEAKQNEEEVLPVTEVMVIDEEEQSSSSEEAPEVLSNSVSVSNAPDASEDIKKVDEIVQEKMVTDTDERSLTSETPSTSKSSTNISESITQPKAVPQSVLDIDNPCDVQDYSEGYEIPEQAPIDAEQPWIKHPITLPQGVLNADEPWVPTTAAGSMYPTLPVVTPTSSASEMPQEPSVPAEIQEAQNLAVEDMAPTSDMAASPMPANNEEIDNAEEDDNPQILYPPQLDADPNDEEFTLAPQAPATPNAPQDSLTYYNPSPMEVLIEMGFEDLNLNRNVLSECEGDINRAVQVLLYREERNARPPQQRVQQRQQRHRNGGFFA